MQISRQRRRKKICRRICLLCIQLWNHRQNKEHQRKKAGQPAATTTGAEFDSKKIFIIEVSKKIWRLRCYCASSISSPASLWKNPSQKEGISWMICCRLVPELLPVSSSSSVPELKTAIPLLQNPKRFSFAIPTALQTSNLSNAQVSS